MNFSHYKPSVLLAKKMYAVQTEIRCRSTLCLIRAFTVLWQHISLNLNQSSKSTVSVFRRKPVATAFDFPGDGGCVCVGGGGGDPDPCNIFLTNWTNVTHIRFHQFWCSYITIKYLAVKFTKYLTNCFVFKVVYKTN